MELNKEKLKNARVFKDPYNEDSSYYITSPTADDIRGADWEYSKIYTKSLVEGITTSSEMMDILTRRGIIGPDFEQRAQELAEILDNKIVALNTTVDIMEKQYLAMEVAESRDNLIQWNQRLQVPLSNTCEHIADDTRIDFLTSKMAKDSNGDPIWKTFNDYLNEGNRGLSRQARYEVMLLLQGLPSDILETTPEAKALREVSDELSKLADDNKEPESLDTEDTADASTETTVAKEKKPRRTTKKVK